MLHRYLLTAVGYVAAVPFSFSDYGSGGAVLSPGDPGETHDYGMAGFIVTTADRVEELGAPRGDEERQLRGELRDWAAFVAGEVVGYVVKDTDGEVVDSCWGFYPEHFTPEEREQYGRPATDDGLEYVRQEARDAAESERDERIERAERRQLGWALARVGSPVTSC